MRPIATDGEAWSVSVSACPLAIFVSSAKTDKLIKMLFGGILMLTQGTMR